MEHRTRENVGEEQNNEKKGAGIPTCVWENLKDEEHSCENSLDHHLFKYRVPLFKIQRTAKKERFMRLRTLSQEHLLSEIFYLSV